MPCTLTHLLTYITFDPWRKILIAGEWSFDRLSLFFWQCRQCVADKVDPLSHPAKIWNWRIIVSPSRVAVLSTAILWISASLWLWLGWGKRVSTADIKAFRSGIHWCCRFCVDEQRVCTPISASPHTQFTLFPKDRSSTPCPQFPELLTD